MTTTEIWKPIPAYDGYYSVSSHGRVRSEHRRIEHAHKFGWCQRRIRERILRASRSGHVALAQYGHNQHVRVDDLVRQVFGTDPAVDR